MRSTSFVLLLCSLLSYVASYGNLIAICSFKDNQCMKKEYEKGLRLFGPTGIPGLNIDPIDPMIFKNITMPESDGVVLTIKECAIEGLSKCEFDRISIDLENKLESKDIICDELKIRCEFFDGTNSMLQNVFGTNSSSGHGNGNAKLEKLTVKLNLPVTVVKKEDGDTYIKIFDEELRYKYDIQRAEFDTKYLFIGNNDFSEVASKFLTINWKTLIDVLVDKVLEFFTTFSKNFTTNVPTKYFIQEDLSQYVTNEAKGNLLG